MGSVCLGFVCGFVCLWGLYVCGVCQVIPVIPPITTTGFHACPKPIRCAWLERSRAVVIALPGACVPCPQRSVVEKMPTLWAVCLDQQMASCWMPHQVVTHLPASFLCPAWSAVAAPAWYCSTGTPSAGCRRRRWPAPCTGMSPTGGGQAVIFVSDVELVKRCLLLIHSCDGSGVGCKEMWPEPGTMAAHGPKGSGCIGAGAVLEVLACAGGSMLSIRRFRHSRLEHARMSAMLPSAAPDTEVLDGGCTPTGARRAL